MGLMQSHLSSYLTSAEKDCKSTQSGFNGLYNAKQTVGVSYYTYSLKKGLFFTVFCLNMYENNVL